MSPAPPHSPGEPHGGFRISTWAIKNPVPVAVLFIALVLAGIVSYGGLPIKQFPNIQFPLVTITVTENGAAPGEMETQITRPIEDAMAGLSNVKDIQSTVSRGVSTTAIEFELGQDLQQKTEEVRSRVDQARAILPREIDPPTVTKVELDSQPILTYAVEAPAMSDAELSWFIDDTISRALQAEKGVSQISRVGGVNREINVLVHPQQLTEHGLTAADLNNALRAFDVDSAGGRVQVGGREQTLRVLGSVNTLSQLRDLTIPAGGGRYVKLTDVADVGDGSSEVRGFARYNGRPVVGFQVMKTRDSSDVRVDDAVVAKLAKLQAQYKDVKFVRIFSSVDETRASFHATQHVLLEGMILAALVVFLFLRDWRSTLITAFAMPVSLIPTFFIMHLFGFSLNVVTLLALTLVIGILVDDAIVEIENIEKRVAQGMRPYQASMQGADAIGLAVVATTFAIVVVFMPVSFMGGIPGQFFREFGITVSVAVLFSLVVARLLTPLMAAYLLKATHDAKPRKPFEGFYHNALEWALDHRIVASIFGGVMFVASLFLIPLLPQGFQPAGDPDYVYVNLQGPPGSSVASMEDVAQKVSSIFVGHDAVRGVFTQVGSTAATGGPGFGRGGGADLTDGTVIVLLNEHRSLRGDDLKNQTRQQLRSVPDARVGFLDFQGGAGIQQVLTGDDPVALQRAAFELEKEMRTLPLIADPRPSVPPIGPEVVIRPRAAAAARRPGGAGGDPGRHRRQRGQAHRGRAPHPDPHPPAGRRPRRPAADQGPAGPRGRRRPHHPGRRGRRLFPGRSRPDPAPEPRTPADGHRRTQRHGPGPGLQGDPEPADHEAPAPGGASRGARPDPGHAGAVRQLRQGGGGRGADDLRRAGPAVPLVLQAVGDPLGPAPGRGRRLHGPADLPPVPEHPLADRLPDAAGPGRQELDPAGGVRHRARARGHEPARGPAGGLPRAGPAHRHDHRGHGRRHAAHGAGPGKGRGIPPAHGRGGDRRPDHLDPAVPGAGAGGLRVRRRFRAVAEAQARPAHHPAGGPGRHAAGGPALG
jgi:preprotein translocase subunit SecF